MSTASVTTLGSFALKVNGISTHGPATRKARALMAFLVMNRDADAARDRLLETFWPSTDPERARGSLKTALWSIRRCLTMAGLKADEFLLSTKATLRWTGDTSIDALQFAELARREDPAASQEALQLYRGDFLEGDYDDWAVSERERLASLYESVLARVVKASKDTDAAQRFIARNPYDEEAYSAIVEAELNAGRRSSAAAWVERCRKALSDVGEKPSSEFESHYGNIVHIEPVAPDELMLPFTGRETEIGFLAARLADAAKGHGSVTLVHGEAGIGKSTLLDRAAHLATVNGLRALVVRCASEAASPFDPWSELFSVVEAGDFDTFARTHASDLVTAIRQAIVASLPEPTALIVDDVHELTGGALDIFAALSQAAGSAHAVIAGMRPEGVSLLRSRLADVPFEELPIGRLDRTNLKWALAQTLGNDQPEVLDVLYDRTGGHPLFFTGLLNSLVNAGTLTRDGHRWQLTKSVNADMKLPDTVRRFIETRLHARGDNARAVACALALEPSASSDDIVAALRFDEATTLDALDDLLALGLITQPETGAQFAFAHELIREVAASGLNAGRRTALHRAFAQRLKSSGQLEVSVRLARHYKAAGDLLSAAQSYLKAAEEALEWNAVQDAIHRCDSGVREIERLEHSPRRDVLLTTLQRTAARATIASGDADGAIKRARDAVNFSRAAEDLHESTRAMLDLAVMEGMALHFLEQRADAIAAVENARLCGDVALQAQALIQQARATRGLGLREEALQTSRSAYNLALKSGRSDIALPALEELLRAQMTWWLFSDALETACAGLDAARRAEPLVEASFLQARCGLWYLLERCDEAKSELQAALQIANETLGRRQESLTGSVHPQPYLQFACHYIAGKIAMAQGQWNQAIEATDKAAALTNVAKLPRHREALTLLRIDALLRRNLPGDNGAAHDMTAMLGASVLAQGTIGWSDCGELALARVAARLRKPGAGTQLLRAADTLEENAHRALLDTDVAFARLAEAACEANEPEVAEQARARSKYYKSHRVASAGAAWGGEMSV